MVEVLALVLHHDEQAVLVAVELALEDGVPSKTHVLNRLHRLVDGKTTPPIITAPQALTLATSPRPMPNVTIPCARSARCAMRHDPAAGALVIMLRSLKMRGMAQAVDELAQQGAPAFQAAIPMLSQLLKAETAEREVRSMVYQIKFPLMKPQS